MKIINFVLILVLAIGSATARVKMLPRRPKKKQKIVKDSVSVKKSSIKKKGNSKLLKVLKAENKLLKQIALQRMATPFIWERGERILSTDVFEGRLRHAVFSTALQSGIDVTIDPNEKFPQGAIVKCEGSTSVKRIDARCNKLVTPTIEIAIDAKIQELDGTFGIRGHVYTGDEKFIAGIFASKMAEGALAVSQYKYLANLGEPARNLGKAQILQGLINGSAEVSNAFTEKLNKNNTAIFVKANKRVRIYFNETVIIDRRKKK